MPASESSTETNKNIEVIDQMLRAKYLEIVRLLNLEELKHFNKVRYKEMVKSDIIELISRG